MILAFVSTTSLTTITSSNINQPFHYRMRELLRRDPPLHPQLKILSYDDGSVDRLQRADLTIDDWATVLSAIAEAKPKVILIDKIFSILFDPLNQKSEAIAKLKNVQVPIIVGAFALEAVNKTRHPLDLTKPSYQLGPLLESHDARRPDYLTFRNWYVYGPHPDLQATLGGAGHILYYGEGMVSVMLQPKPDLVVPHITLINERKSFIDGDLFVNGLKVPLDRNGQVLVNFSREAAYYDRHRRLGTAVLNARQGKPISDIKAGDTVLILPEMYTGSTDFKKTPLGILPGGFILASMLNSVLSNAWLGVLPGLPLQLAVLALLGTLWGAFRKSLSYWLGMTLLATGIVAAGVYLFAFRSAAPDTALHLAAFVGASVIMFVDRNQRREKEASRIADELNEAAEMAKAFRPDDVPNWPFCEIASFHKPFSEASGDWFSFRKSESGRYFHFVLVDVTGHGVQAALAVSICKTVLALYRERSETVESANFLVLYARVLNEMLYHHGKGRHLLTMLGVTFDVVNSEAHFLSAGHPPPILYTVGDSGERTVKSLSTRTTVLGLTETFNGRTRSQKLAPGDEILAYTDGLPIGRHLRPLNSYFNGSRDDFAKDPEVLLKTLWNSEYKKTGKTLDDDVSIIWFKMAGRAAAKPEEPSKNRKDDVA